MSVKLIKLDGAPLSIINWTPKNYPFLYLEIKRAICAFSSPNMSFSSLILSCYWQILKYLVVSDRLCELGYDEAQVEEALEMFQNCESKVTPALQKKQLHAAIPKYVLLLTLNSLLGCWVPAPSGSV